MIQSIRTVLWLILIFGASVVTGNGCSLPQEIMIPFIDVSAKIPTSILSGNLIDLGAFDQCLALDITVDNDRYRGKYCLVKLIFKPLLGIGIKYMPIVSNDGTGLGLLLGWCIPDSCSIQNVTQQTIEGIQGLSAYMMGVLDNIEIIPFMDGLCQTQEGMDKAASTFTQADVGTLGFFASILAIMILSTIYDMYLHYTNRKPAHALLIAFSIKTNGAKLLAVRDDANQLPCLHGIRFISMMWIIYAHRVVMILSDVITNLRDLLSWAGKVENMHVMGATVSVDTFLFLSGFLVAYAFLLAKAKGAQFNIITFWLHRYIRLTPAYGAMMLVQATLINRLGSGPLWSLINDMQTTCVKGWWHSLLYIQNYFVENICIGQTWYLAVDFQLFFLSPLILIPLWRRPKHTLYASFALVFGSMAISFLVSYHYDFGLSMQTAQNTAYVYQYYYATHTRFGPWLMGLMMGYYIFTLRRNTDTKCRLHPLLVIVGWLLSLTLLLTVLFAPHNILKVHDRVANAFFNGMHRHAWTLGLCWVVYACLEGYGGPINAFLSWTPFQVLGRLCYAMFLIHMTVQRLINAETRTSSYSTAFRSVYKFWGDFFITLVFSICLSLSFESPMVAIEKVIFRTGTAPKTPEPPSTEQKEEKFIQKY